MVIKTISYAITTCDEYNEIKQLIPYILENKRKVDEIVVLVDLIKNRSGTPLLDYLYELQSNNKIVLIEGDFKRDFAEWKNLLKKVCKNDFIFQIDADETPDAYLLSILPTILESNPDIELYLVPRVNLVKGITQEHIQKWGWNVTNEGWINWPDYQSRIWMNIPRIGWMNKVHERIVGFKTYTQLPMDEAFSLHHYKTIGRQEKQNKLYENLQ